MTIRTHLVRYIALALAAATWVFMFLAIASFSVTDWPSHAVYFDSKSPATVQNLCGPTGSMLAYYCYMALGQGVYPVLLFSAICIAVWFTKSRISDLWLRGIGLLMLSVAFSAAIHQLRPGSPDGFPEGNGGLLGIATAKFLLHHFNNAGSVLVLLTSFLVGLLLAADDLVLGAPKAAMAAYGRVQAHAAQTAGAGTAEAGTHDDDGSDAAADQAPAAGWRDRLSPRNWLPAPMARWLPARKDDARQIDSEPGVSAAEAVALLDDAPTTDNRKILLNPHNLLGDELELSYANDEPLAHYDLPATETALSQGAAEPAPAALIEIPERPAALPPPPPVVNHHAASNPQPPSAAVSPATVAPTAESNTAAPATDDTATNDTEAGDDSLEVAAPKAGAPSGGPANGPIVRSAATLQPKVHAPPPTPRELGDYRLPGWEALAEPEQGYAEAQEQYVRAKAKSLEEALRSFDIDATVVSIDTGPVITMYELMLPSGMKVASITQLGNDIARALKSTGGIRIVAPVPGKDTVGIEVPNPQKEKVRLKELFASAPEAREKMAIPIYLGKDAAGQALVTDLTKMPHCLIAGTTGSGKSVCINTIVMSIIYHQRPDHVKLILIDPKVVELKPFSEIPHLMCPPINDPNKAPSVLEWLCTKMDERYELLAEAGVRQIGDYNRLTRDQLREIFQPANEEEEAKIPKFLPYIVVIIDELADLMMMSGKEVEAAVVRLAQKSRAVGIHVVLATQRPQANVVTGLIKSNMPSRIAFRVQSRMDSRIVLDQNGAELLLGQGDMLFLPNGASRPIRSQGTFIDDFEVHRSVKVVKELAEAQYEPELVQIRQMKSDAEFEHDDLYEDAVKVVIETKRGSVSLLQRRLSIGYARASRLIERMAATGILGDYKGSQSREVMFTLEEWEAAKAAQQKDQDEGMSV